MWRFSIWWQKVNYDWLAVPVALVVTTLAPFVAAGIVVYVLVAWLWAP